MIGGIELPRKLILSSLNSGKSVVTANKALLADHTGELAEAAEANSVDLYFEAAVAGAIPRDPPAHTVVGRRPCQQGRRNRERHHQLHPLRDGRDRRRLRGDPRRSRTPRIRGSRPDRGRRSYDAAAKAAILASIAFHTRVTAADVYREGISTITSADLASAKALDCTIKLLSICERIVTPKGKERISARVYPALVPLSHPLASVNGAFNAVVVEAENAGRLMFYGQGAGGAPPASAVMGDLVMAARNKVHGGRGPRESKYAKLKVAPMGDILTRYYVNMEVADKEGVLSAVAAEFAKHGVSISVVRQEGAARRASGGRHSCSNRRGSLRDRGGPQRTRIRHRCDQRAATGRH